MCGWVDFDQQLAFAHLVAGFHMNLLDLPGRLGADVDITPRLQGAQGGDAVFYIATGDGRGDQGRPAWRDRLPRGEGHGRKQSEGEKPGASGRAGTFHAGFRPVISGPSQEGQGREAVLVNERSGREFTGVKHL